MRLFRIALESKHTVKGFERIPNTADNVKKYRPQYYGLSHIRTGSSYSGVILIDGDKFVAVLQCNMPRHEIQALDVHPDYRRQGIAGALLNLANREFDCNKLTVRNNNDAAIALYKKHGYKIVKEEGSMLFMEK